MTKKLLLLSLLLVIFWFWVSFANPIAGPGLIKYSDVCYKLKNSEIDNYKVIIKSVNPDNNSFSWNEDDRDWEVYEPNIKECTKRTGYGESKVYLVDKNIDVKSITKKNIDDSAIFIWYIPGSNRASYYDETKIYEIINRWGEYQLELVQAKTIKNIRRFPFFWLWAVIIETLVLFYIAKLFWKDNNVSNKKLLLFWIIPTTVTLPLLWFVLPLLMWDWTRYVVIWELLVIMIESIIIKYWLKISWIKAIIVSFICNLLSFLLSYKSLCILVPILLYFLIKPLIVKLLWKNDEISNKRLILLWIFGPIVSVILSILLTRIIGLLFDWDLWVLSITLLSYIVLEILIMKYWLKISRKKSIISFILFIISFIIVLFVLYICLYLGSWIIFFI